MRNWFVNGVCLGLLGLMTQTVGAEDYLHALQTSAIEQNRSPLGHWGWDAQNYTAWASHSNRLIPIYTFGTRGQGAGVDLESYTGENSLYRDAEQIRRLYHNLPQETLNPKAEYCDQTNIYDLQRAAVKAGKKQIFLVIFDGMDWQTTFAASTYKQQKIAYTEGRGTGLHFQDYAANNTTQFGYMVTSPYCDRIDFDVNTQTVQPETRQQMGGYAIAAAGEFP